MKSFTAIIKKGEKQFVALCPELDVVSQGYTVEEAIKNLKEVCMSNTSRITLSPVKKKCTSFSMIRHESRNLAYAIEFGHIFASYTAFCVLPNGYAVYSLALKAVLTGHDQRSHPQYD